MSTTTRRRGFTLLEMLVVLFILASVAALGASMLGEADEQLRYDDTRNRLEAIRRAVLGGAADGRPGPAGFAADMGRLPTSLRELLAPIADDESPLPPYQVNATTGLGFGWRGPYLHSLRSATGALEFHDGWGNRPLAGDRPGCFGWAFVPSAESLTLRSRGRDGRDGPPASSPFSYDQDFSDELVQADYQINVSGTVRVTFVGATSMGPVKVRLRLNYVLDGQVKTDIESDSVEQVLNDKDIVHFAFPSAGKWVACGVRTVEVVREDPTGTWSRLGPTEPVQRIELLPRGNLPTSLPAPWRFR